MPSYTILFTGLITHVQYDTKTRRAVFPVGHYPLLGITKGMAHDGGKSLNPGTIPPSFTQEAKNKLMGKTLYDLSGERLVLNTPDSNITLDRTFDDRVPKLTETLQPSNKTDLDPDVIAGNPSGAVNTYVTYTGGTLSALECFSFVIDFSPRGPRDPRCLASGTVYSVSPDTNLRITDVNDPTRYVEADPGAEVIFMNHLDGNNHWHMYHALAKDAKSIAALTAKSTLCIACQPSGKFSVYIGPTVQCTNSQWP